jgi:hypothetical protein
MDQNFAGHRPDIQRDAMFLRHGVSEAYIEGMKIEAFSVSNRIALDRNRRFPFRLRAYSIKVT